MAWIKVDSKFLRDPRLTAGPPHTHLTYLQAALENARRARSRGMWRWRLEWDVTSAVRPEATRPIVEVKRAVDYLLEVGLLVDVTDPRRFGDGMRDIRVQMAEDVLIESDVAPNDRRDVPYWMQSILLRRDGEKCVQCGATERLEFDHIHPWSRGGDSDEHNIQILCQRCNGSKGDR